LKAKNYLLFAISGSQTEIVAKVAAYYGFDDYVGTVYGRGNGKFGGVESIGSFHKDRTLKQLVKKHGASFSGSLGIGDSQSDIPMLELVEQPVAFNPEKDLFRHAKDRGWKVVIERKNLVFELESKDGKYELVKAD
jgi:phosphoserine phosphatase